MALWLAARRRAQRRAAARGDSQSARDDVGGMCRKRAREPAPFRLLQSVVMIVSRWLNRAGGWRVDKAKAGRQVGWRGWGMM